MSNKRLAINIISNCIAFAVNFLVSFFLTPYIVKHVGKEVYGFVSLGNNFVNYASLIALAINSMASRFITIKIEQEDYKSANKYFSSILICNIIICLILLIPSSLIVIFLDKIINVPKNNVIDIKVLWSLLFVNFFIGIIGEVYSVATFVKDRIDLAAKRNIVSYIMKAIILVVTYYFFNPYVFFVGVATIISTIYNTIVNIKYTKELLPEVKFKRENFDNKSIKELFFSGIWNTISRVGSIALTELDLLLSNVLISASAMGTLSLVKVVPNYIVSLISTITTAFMPQLTISYAKNENGSDELLKRIKNSIRILMFFNAVSYGVIIAFSDKFYSLWLKITDQKELQLMYILGIISVLDCLVSSVMCVIFNIFTVLNKLRLSSITVILTGFINLIVTFLVVKFTNLGLYAIAGISICLVIIRNIFILIPYATKLLKLPWYTFYKFILKNIIVIAISVAIGFTYKSIFVINSWFSFIIVCGITSVTILFVNTFLVLTDDERKMIVEKTIRKIKK